MFCLLIRNFQWASGKTNTRVNAIEGYNLVYIDIEEKHKSITWKANIRPDLEGGPVVPARALMHSYQSGLPSSEVITT
jgi:hypothetical protein